LTYESPGGFESEDEIAYVDSDGNWIPVDSNIKQVGDTISASVDQCSTVFGAGPVYNLEVTVNCDPSVSVDENHPIYVGAFCVNWADAEPYASEPITSSGGSYTFALPSEDYVLFIFFDENNDGEPNIGEPYQYYDGSENEAGATAITVDTDQTVTVDLDDTYTLPAIGSVSITFPSGQTLSSDFTATGTYSGDVNSIDVQIDGTPEGSAVLNAAAETWSCDVSVSGLAEAAHMITVNAYYNGTPLDSDDSSFTYSITPVNNDPVLSLGSVSPTIGDTSTAFTYSVDYYDIDGNAPSTIQVYIDGSASSMTFSSGTSTSNGTYTLSGVALAAGSHTYYFTCDDGNGGSDRLPETGTYSGPTVTGLPTQVTATFTFIDYFSGDPVKDVEWYDYESNQILTSGADGTMSISGDSPLRMRGYFASVPTGYVLEDVYYIDAYLTEDLSRTIPIEPDEANTPPVMGISGTLNAKGGGTISNGSIEIFTDDGREIGSGYATGAGGYEGGVLSTGNLYFIVTDYDTGEVYYAVENVSGPGTYNISPPSVPDVTLSGSAPAGTEVVAHLLLGEEFVELESQDVQAGSFSFAIPIQGSDIVRLECFFEDADGNDWTYYDPTEYTASVSGIGYSTVFSGVSVPDTWTSNLAWDDLNAILTWDSADDISFDVSCYEIEFVSTDLEIVLNAIIEDTGVRNQIETPFGAGDLFIASILPVYSEGYIEGFMPAQEAAGVQIWCDDIAGRLMTDNDLSFVYFDDNNVLPSNSVTSVVIDDLINDMVLVGTYGGGVSYSDDLVTWVQLTEADGLTSDSVRDIVVDPYLYGYWIASWGGVDFVDADTGFVLGGITPSTYPELVSDNVYCVAVDVFNEGLWIGTRYGVSFFDYSTEEITNYTNASTSGGLADDWVHDIEVDQYGVVWFCTEGGVSYLDGADWNTYTTADGLAYDSVRGMIFDYWGGIWFTTGLGVSYLDYTESFTTYRETDGLWNNFVNCVAVDEENGVWFGTGNNAASGGVSYFDEHYGFVPITSANGLASGYVKSIAIDPDDGLWIGVYYLP
jgi:ligand-binding sensor domain-containing protein